MLFKLFESIKPKLNRDMEEIRPSCDNNILVITIDDYDDVNETSPSESDPTEVIIIEEQSKSVKHAENPAKASIILHSGTAIMDRKPIPDKRDASFIIIPEETYYEDYGTLFHFS
jgi:hypothetical protein